jgi:hypothetical protein
LAATTSAPEYVSETSSATEAKEPTLLPNVEEPIIIPEIKKMEEPEATETRTHEILSPSAKIEAAKSQKGPAVTPKRKRMVNVLDVLETVKSSSTTPKKLLKLPKCTLKPLLPKLQRTRQRLKLGLQSPPR